MLTVALHLREPEILWWLDVHQKEGGTENVLQRYVTTIDYPACSFYLRLLEYNAKVN